MSKPAECRRADLFGLRVIAARTFSIIAGVRAVPLFRPSLQLHADAVHLKEMTHLIMVRTSGTLP